VLRVALVSDIHANAVALRAVLESARQQGADELICLGDVATLGVAPAEVVQQLRDLGCRCIRGNHEDYLLDPDLRDAHVGSSIVRESIDWARERLSQDDLAFLRAFEPSIELRVAETEVLLFHGSPLSNTVDLLAETSADELDAQLGERRAAVMAGGHTHLQMLRQHRGTLLVNPGSVGAPFAEVPRRGPPRILDHAEYATLDLRPGHVSVSLHRVGLDRQELYREMRASTLPLGPWLAATYA